MKLRTKLMASFLAIIVVMGLVDIVGLRGLHKLKEHFDELAETVTPALEELGTIRSTSFRMFEATTSYTLATLQGAGRENLAREKAEIVKSIEDLERAISNYERLVSGLKADYPQIRELITISAQAAETCRSMLQRLETEGTAELWLLKDELELLEDRLVPLIDFSIEIEKAVKSNRASSTTRAVREVVHLYLWSTLTVIWLSAAICWLFVRTITKPIERLKHAAAQVGGGNLHVTIPRDSGDEFGDLADSFNLMVRNLDSTTVSKQYVDNILSSMADILLVSDKDLVIRTANEAASVLLGYTTAELLTLKLNDIWPGATASMHNLIRRDERAVKADFHEDLFLTRTGDRIPVSISLSVMTLDNDSEEVICLARDVREKKRAEAELNEYRQKLAHAEQMASLGTIGAIIAHKFNQPLTTLRLFLQQCRREADASSNTSHQMKENLREGLDEIDFMSGLIKQLVGRTRRPMGQGKELINLDEVARRALKVLAEDAADAGVKVLIEGLDVLPPITGLQEQIEEVFYLLIQNVVQAATSRGAGGELKITGKRDKSSVHLTFADTCGGIPPETLPHIFDLFFSTKQGEGLGLGLSIAEHIVNSHAGRISVESEYGKGTFFYVTFPL